MQLGEVDALGLFRLCYLYLYNEAGTERQVQIRYPAGLRYLSMYDPGDYVGFSSILHI